MSPETLGYLLPTVALAIALFASYWQYEADEKKWKDKAAQAFLRGRQQSRVRYVCDYDTADAMAHYIKEYWEAGFREGIRVERPLAREEGWEEGFEEGFEFALRELDALAIMIDAVEMTWPDFRQAYVDLRND